MSTLEAVRTILCHPPEAPASEILKSARDEIARLLEATRTAKNIQQRNGAKKKLADLQPMMAALEVEANLTAYEESIAREGKGSASQRAAARVQVQKLAIQIAALPNNEEKEVFQQWFADLNSSLARASTSESKQTPPPEVPPVVIVAPAPVSPPEPVSVRVPKAETAPPVVEPSTSTSGGTVRVDEPLPQETTPLVPIAPVQPRPIVRPPPLPPVDPTIALNNALATLDIKAKARPLLDSKALSRDLETLSGKVAALPDSEKKTALERRIATITTAIKFQEELRQLAQAVDAMQQTSKDADADLTALSLEFEQVNTRATPLLAMPEAALIRQKLAAVKSALTTRRQIVEIDAAIQKFSARIDQARAASELSAELDTLADRIDHVPESAARVALSSRLDPLRKRITQRREEEKIFAAMAAARQLLEEPDSTPAVVRPALDLVMRQVQSLAPGTMRANLEKELHECAELFTALEAKFAPKPPQKAVVLRLEPIKGRSIANARPLVFVARDRFSIGRLPEKEAPRADFLTPSAETRISRVHVSFLVRQGKIHILAGEEGKPSTNPALLDDAPLASTPTATSFEGERRIDLTGVLHLRAKLLPSSTPFGPPLDEETLGAGGGATVVMPPISGCLRIRPQGEDMLPTLAVWVFTDASIGAAPTCAISLPGAKISPEQARIHFWQKSFWVEALRASPTVELAGKTVVTGASQPLRSDQELRLGDSFYTVRLS